MWLCFGAALTFDLRYSDATPGQLCWLTDGEMSQWSRGRADDPGGSPSQSQTPEEMNVVLRVSLR